MIFNWPLTTSYKMSCLTPRLGYTPTVPRPSHLSRLFLLLNLFSNSNCHNNPFLLLLFLKSTLRLWLRIQF